MDFELTDEQHALQEVIHDLVQNECPPALLRAVVEDREDGSTFWKTLVDNEWTGLAVDEADGGSGASAVELVIALEQLGWGGDPAPYLATTSQYVPLLQECAGEDLRHELLQAVCDGGSGTVAFAVDTVRATRATGGGEWRLAGTATYVFDGDRADQVAVVAAFDEGSDEGAGGVGVFVVPADAVSATRRPTFDRSLHVADLALDGVSVAADRAITGADVAGGVGRATQVAVTGLAMEMVGASQRVLELVLDHIKGRKQFGVAIGSFQAVKHMAVDMYVAIQRARALCQYAALTVAEDDPRRAVAASMAKAAAGDCQQLSARHGIQLFGGLGYTWENDVQLYMKRAKAGELLLGTAKEHRARVARATLPASIAAATATREGAR